MRQPRRSHLETTRVLVAFLFGAIAWLGLSSSTPCQQWPLGWRCLYWGALVVGGFLGGIGDWRSIIISPIYMTLGHLLGAFLQNAMCRMSLTSPFLIPYWFCMLAFPIAIAGPASLAGHLAWCVTTSSRPFDTKANDRSRRSDES